MVNHVRLVERILLGVVEVEAQFKPRHPCEFGLSEFDLEVVCSPGRSDNVRQLAADEFVTIPTDLLNLFVVEFDFEESEFAFVRNDKFEASRHRVVSLRHIRLSDVVGPIEFEVGFFDELVDCCLQQVSNTLATGLGQVRKERACEVDCCVDLANLKDELVFLFSKQGRSQEILNGNLNLPNQADCLIAEL